MKIIIAYSSWHISRPVLSLWNYLAFSVFYFTKWSTILWKNNSRTSDSKFSHTQLLGFTSENTDWVEIVCQGSVRSTDLQKYYCSAKSMLFQPTAKAEETACKIVISWELLGTNCLFVSSSPFRFMSIPRVWGGQKGHKVFECIH